jgi:hypothetical protein
MSERGAGKKFSGLLSRPALARRVDLSATSLSLKGREGPRTAGQDGQDGRDRTGGLLSCPSYPSCPSFFDPHPQEISPTHEGHDSEIAILKALGVVAATVSHNGAGNLCDVAPSRFKRFDRDEYFTIDAGWIIPALCCAVQVEGPILEPCAGRGHMVRELRALGFVVRGADLFAYADSLVPDMKTGVDVFDLESLAGYRFIVTNLPYREQAAILAHLPADRGPRWSPRGGPRALRMEFGQGSRRACA